MSRNLLTDAPGWLRAFPTCTLQIASIQLRPWAALLAWKVYAATAL